MIEKENKCYSYFILDELSDYEEEIQLFDNIIEENPKNFAALNNRGVLYWEIGKLSQARTDLALATSHSSQDGIPHQNFGRLLEDLGEFEAALEAYGAALKTDSTNPYFNRSIASLLASQHRWEEAINHFSRAMDVQKDNPYLLRERAGAYDALGLSAEAERDRAKALSLDPSSQE